MLGIEHIENILCFVVFSVKITNKIAFASVNQKIRNLMMAENVKTVNFLCVVTCESLCWVSIAPFLTILKLTRFVLPDATFSIRWLFLSIWILKFLLNTRKWICVCNRSSARILSRTCTRTTLTRRRRWWETPRTGRVWWNQSPTSKSTCTRTTLSRVKWPSNRWSRRPTRSWT